MMMKLSYSGDKLTISPLYPKTDKLPFISKVIIDDKRNGWAVHAAGKLALGTIAPQYRLSKIDNKYHEIIFSNEAPNEYDKKLIDRRRKKQQKYGLFGNGY